MMARAPFFAALLAPLLGFGALAPACTTPIDTSCPIALAESLGAYIVKKEPLNNQSDCAGASRVPYSNPQGVGPQSIPSTDDCIVCLVHVCLAQVENWCPGNTSPVTCWESSLPVRACYLAAFEDTCAAACSSATTTDAGPADAGDAGAP
jgi:hypothetical protein